MKNILILGVGGPTPRAFVKSILQFGGELGKNFNFIGVDCNPFAYGLYQKNVFKNTYLIPKVNSKDYWPRINKIILTENIDAAIVLPEKEVIEWSKNASKRLNKKIILHLPSPDLALLLVNKFSLYTALKDTVLIPKFVKVYPKNIDFTQIVKEVGLPFWIRGTEGSSGFGALKISSEEELSMWLVLNKKISQFLASEYLPNKNLACKVLYLNNKLISTASNERVNYLMAKVAPSGITGNVSFAKLINDKRLVELAKNALEIISKKVNSNINGIFTVDFKEDLNGIPKITEINIRYIATVACYAEGGANIPLDQLNLMFSSSNSPNETKYYKFEEGLVFFREVDEVPILMKEKDILK